MSSVLVPTECVALRCICESCSCRVHPVGVSVLSGTLAPLCSVGGMQAACTGPGRCSADAVLTELMLNLQRLQQLCNMWCGPSCLSFAVTPGCEARAAGLAVVGLLSCVWDCMLKSWVSVVGTWPLVHLAPIRNSGGTGNLVCFVGKTSSCGLSVAFIACARGGCVHQLVPSAAGVGCMLAGRLVGRLCSTLVRAPSQCLAHEQAAGDTRTFVTDRCHSVNVQ